MGKGLTDEEILRLDGQIRLHAASDDLAAQQQLATALLERGNRQHELGQLESARQSFESIIQRFRDSDDIVLRGRVAAALTNDGRLLLELGELDHALSKAVEASDRFARDSAAEVQVVGLQALVLQCTLHDRRGEQREAMAIGDHIIEVGSNSPNTQVKALVADAYLSKASRLYRSGDFSNAIETYRALDEMLAEHADDPRLLGASVSSHSGMAAALVRLNRLEEAVQLCDSVIDRAPVETVLPNPEAVADAMWTRAVALEKLRRPRAAANAYSMLVDWIDSGRVRDTDGLRTRARNRARRWLLISRFMPRTIG